MFASVCWCRVFYTGSTPLAFVVDKIFYMGPPPHVCFWRQNQYTVTIYGTNRNLVLVECGITTGSW